MDRYRLIAGIVVCFIYLLAMYPWQTITIGIIVAIAYFVLSNTGTNSTGNIVTGDNGRERRRRDALDNAKIYLAPYSDIWRNLKLSNTYCTLRLQSNGYTIVARETVLPYRNLRITKSNVHTDSDLWDMFCNVFNHNTTFDHIVELCHTFHADYRIDEPRNTSTQTPNYSTTSHSQNNSNDIKVDAPIPVLQEQKKEKLDVNNASEVELTALPGISIVMAKKIIKKREEIGGFKDVNDFLLFTQVKSHIKTQLRDIVCVNKMRGSGKIRRNSERSVDL